MMLSVLIPALNEPYLLKTIEDVKKKAIGEIEIIVKEGNNMRRGINEAVKESKGEFILKIDAHCMVDEGFDLKLIEAHKHNLVQVPRRKRLDPITWTVIEDGRPPIDNEYIIFQNLLAKAPTLTSKGFIWGSPWDNSGTENLMHFQGSCWFMSKDWFNHCGFMCHDYGGFAQESEEILFRTIEKGGDVKINKNTWYAHWHKPLQERSKLNLDQKDLAKGLSYSYDKWITPEFFIPFVGRFDNIPGWPVNWKKLLWG